MLRPRFSIRLLSILTTLVGVALVFLFVAPTSFAQPLADEIQSGDAGKKESLGVLMDVLSVAESHQVDQSVEKALRWLASQQGPDGSFPTRESGNPGVTGLCLMAFLSAGHVPGEGDYGRVVQRSVEYILSSQRADGLFARASPDLPVMQWNEGGHTATYNQAIASLALTEVFGMSDAATDAKITPAIEKSLRLVIEWQRRFTPYVEDRGGWRYIRPLNNGLGDADLSVTTWMIMFLRSARNAEFDVPQEDVERALPFVRHCFDEQSGGFRYGLLGIDRGITRAMTGAGIVSLSLSGHHQTAMAQAAGDWLLKFPFTEYNGRMHHRDRYHYSAYYCSQASLQLGGKYWKVVYPDIARALVRNQSPEGTWEAENPIFGTAYTTALTVLSLTPPYQLLPIYQR